jgi:hypothetical protein
VKQSGVWWQIARLAFSSAGRTVTNLMRRIGDTLYAGLVVLRDGAAPVLAFLATMILPTVSARWAGDPRPSRARALALTGIRVTVTGSESLPRGNAGHPVQHTSYMDAVIIASVMPGEPAFVAKKEFADQPFAGRLHAPARRVVRRALRRGREPRGCRDGDGLANRGRLFVFFPEGTFTRGRLLGFYMGAVQGGGGGEPAGGARHLARRVLHAVGGDQWFPAPDRDRVVIEQPIVPSGTTLRHAGACATRARAAMLKHFGGTGSRCPGRSPRPPW